MNASIYEGKGKPTSRWMLSYVLSELFSSGRWFYSLLCMLMIGMAIIYILLPGYYREGIYEYNKKIMLESMGTKIIVNCPNIRNPSMMFTESKIEEFKSDPRIEVPYPRVELGVKLSIGTEEPQVTYAEGCIPNSPITYKNNMFCGRGLSSLKAREIVISEALYRKLFGKEPGGDETVNMSVSRTVDRVKQSNNFKLRVVGVLKKGHWSRVYMPLRFLEQLDMWCDNSIEMVPSESGDVASSIPEPGSISGTLFVPEAISQEELERECKHWNITIKEQSKPFYEVLSEDSMVWFRVSRKDGKLIYESDAKKISDSLPAKSIAEPSRSERLELFFGKITDKARVVGLMPEDKRISGIRLDNGEKLSDLIEDGDAVISESFAKHLRSKSRDGRRPRMLSNGTSMVSNTLLIKGIAPNDTLNSEWDIMCGIEELALLRRKFKSEPVCLVSTSDQYMISMMQEEYGNESMHVSSEDVAEILYYKLIRKRGRRRREMSFEESIETIKRGNIPPRYAYKIKATPAPYGYHEIFAGKEIMYAGYYWILFVPDNFISGILIEQNISIPKGTSPMVAVLCPEDRRGSYCIDDANFWAEGKNISVVCKVYGDMACFLLPESLKDRICPDAVKMGFIGKAKPAGYTHSPDLSKSIKRRFHNTKLVRRSFLFTLLEERKNILQTFSIFKESLKIAEILHLPDIASKTDHKKLSFAVARPEEISRLPFKWARDYETRGNHSVFASSKSVKGTSLRLGREKITAIEKIGNGELPDRLVLLPLNKIRNNRMLIDEADLGFNSVDVGCNTIAFGRTLHSLSRIGWARTACTSKIETRKLTCYEFRDKESNDNGEMRKDLVSMLNTRYPTFVHVMPNISLHIKPSEDNGFLKGFEVMGSSPEDVRRFQLEIVEGGWLKPGERGIILPMDALAGGDFDGHPGGIPGKYIDLNFEREKKRSYAEPELSIQFRVDGIVSGNRGYIPLDLAKNVSLWQTNKVSYLESGSRFILPADIYRGTGYSQCNLFVKEINMLKPVVEDLQSKGYTTYDTLDKQELLRKMGNVLMFMVFLLMFGPTISGITTVTVITLLNKMHRIHEIGNLKAYGAGKGVIKTMFLYHSLILGIGAYAFAVFVGILIEPTIQVMLQKVFSVPFNSILSFPIYSIRMWKIYVLAFFVSVGCCMLSLGIAYLKVRRLPVVDSRKQY